MLAVASLQRGQDFLWMMTDLRRLNLVLQHRCTKIRAVQHISKTQNAPHGANLPRVVPVFSVACIDRAAVVQRQACDRSPGTPRNPTRATINIQLVFMSTRGRQLVSTLLFQTLNRCATAVRDACS